MRTSVLLDVAMELPWWIETLSHAEKWGVPPWEIVSQPKILWVLRQRVYTDTVNMALKDREASKKHGR